MSLQVSRVKKGDETNKSSIEKSDVANPLYLIQSTFFNAKYNEAEKAGDLKAENPFERDYRPIRLLGEGGYGKVLLAEKISSSTERAIKIIHKKDYEGKKYEREFKILKELNHPNVLKYYGSYEHRNKVYLVTEYCPGQELLTEIWQCGKMTEKRAQTYFRELIEALCYIHSKNIVHRDLKPENIIIEKETKRVKLIDFGLSKKMASKDSKMGSEVGTFMYSAPQVDEGRYTKKCDIWSAGIILYLMLTGHYPFNCQTIDEIIKVKKKFKLKFKEYYWCKVSPQARDLLARCMAQKESDRLSAWEAIKHPWLVSDVSDDVLLDNQMVGKLWAYSKDSRLVNNIKYFVCAFNEMEKKEKDLIQLFKQIDKDKNGELTKDEILSAYEENKKIFETLKINKDQLALLFNQIDLDNSGTIDFLEFIVAIKNFSSDLNQKNLKKAFKELADEQGFLDLNSLKASLGGDLPEQEWLIVLNKYDKDGNGKIDYNEFLAIFKTQLQQNKQLTDNK